MLGLPSDIGNDSASDEDRLIELGDLKVAGAVGIEVGFSIESRREGDISIDRTAELDRFVDSFFVEDGKCSRLSCADDGDVGVRLIAESVGRWTEKLRSCVLSWT